MRTCRVTPAVSDTARIRMNCYSIYFGFSRLIPHREAAADRARLRRREHLPSDPEPASLHLLRQAVALAVLRQALALAVRELARRCCRWEATAAVGARAIARRRCPKTRAARLALAAS